MFSIIRLAIGLVFLVCAILIVIKSNSKHRPILCVVFVSLSITLVFMSSFLPFENIFLNFNSPKASYEYYTIGKSNIALVVEGTACDLLIDRKEDVDVCLIIPKSDKGWKIGIGSNTKKIAQKITDGIVICVYQYKNTKDHFVLVYDTNGREINLSDNYNTKFYPLERDDDLLKKSFVTYYAHIPDIEEQYSLIANEKAIALTIDRDGFA